MASDDYARSLAEAAGIWGLEPGYWDIWGQWHETSPEIQGGVLAAMGVACATATELEAAVAARELAQCSEVAPPSLVIAASSQPAAVPLCVPEEMRGASAAVEIRWESGRFEQQSHELSGLESGGERQAAGGRRFVRRLLPLPALPLGYHEIEIRVASLPPASTRVIVCPDRAWLPESLARGDRRTGLAVSLYGVRSARTWGCGDFTALQGVVDWVAGRIGASYVALNPLCAIHNRAPYNTSPYLPDNAFYRNFIYLDVERVEEFAECAAARRLLDRPEVRAEIAALNAAELVDYDRVAALKLRFLRLLFRWFYQRELPRRSPRAVEFLRWVEAEGELLDRFALHGAIDEWLHRRDPEVWTWHQWPDELRDPSSAASRRFAASHKRSVLFRKWLQWEIDRQLAGAYRHARARGMEIGLFHDLPLAIDRCGAQCWAHREFYVAGCRVGAPPDDFSPKGQDWSFPPPGRDAHRRDGYRFFAESIRRAARHGGALRIDHVMRFFRLWWVADGMATSEGVYVKDYHEDLLRILALESVRQRVMIVGEDLGTVEPEVRLLLRRFGILGCSVFYFEKDGSGAVRPPEDYPPQALVSATTHDLPTIAGFWLGRDIDARRDAGLLPDDETWERMHAGRRAEKQRMLDALFARGLLPPEFPRREADFPELTGELHNAVTGFLASTPCLLMTLNQEDLTKEVDQQNLPGSVHQYPNWRRKMTFSVEDLDSSPAALDFALMLRRWLEQTGRRNVAPA